MQLVKDFVVISAKIERYGLKVADLHEFFEHNFGGSQGWVCRRFRLLGKYIDIETSAVEMCMENFNRFLGEVKNPWEDWESWHRKLL